MHLLLINPNTTTAITDLVLAEARKVARPSTTLMAVTGRFGARYVASRASFAIACHAALDAYAEHAADPVAECPAVVVLACFGDPGLLALKELAPQPVVGMAEASCLAAAARGGRFSIVTGGERWRPMLIEFVASMGLGDRLASVETVAPSGADIARDPDGALDLLTEACTSAARSQGAETVILAGAGLAGIASRISPRVPVPLIDSLAAVIDRAETLATAPPPKPMSGDLAATPPVATVALSVALARTFEPR